MKQSSLLFCQIITCLLVAIAVPCFAQNAVLDTASREVCLDIGIRAQITGLDDITLTTAQGDGEQGAIYTGSDTFFLESNAPVRLYISAGPINNGLSTLPTEYVIDGSSEVLETAGAGSHSGNHSIRVEAQLGSISDQLAGDYSSTLLVTVVPQIPAVSLCKDTQVISELAPEETLSETLLEIEVPLSATEIPVLRSSQELPIWAIRLMEEPQAEKLFPFLIEYRQWLNGLQPALSPQAESWWLFPVDMQILQDLGINILNNR